MKQSQLQLIKNFFPTVNINANPKYKLDEKKGFSVGITAKLTKIPKEKDKYQLDFNIEIEENETCNSPYLGKLQEVGLFSVDKNLSKEDRAIIIHTEGGNILYSAAREFLLSVTGRGPWGPIILPGFGVTEEKDIEEIKAEAAKME